MKKIIAHIICAAVLAAIGVYILIVFPHTLPFLVFACVFICGALAVAVPTPLHEGIVVIDSNAPLLARALGGIIRLGRRETDAVVVQPTDPPKDGAA